MRLGCTILLVWLYKADTQLLVAGSPQSYNQGASQSYGVPPSPVIGGGASSNNGQSSSRGASQSYGGPSSQSSSRGAPQSYGAPSSPVIGGGSASNSGQSSSRGASQSYGGPSSPVIGGASASNSGQSSSRGASQSYSDPAGVNSKPLRVYSSYTGPSNPSQVTSKPFGSSFSSFLKQLPTSETSGSREVS